MLLLQHAAQQGAGGYTSLPKDTGLPVPPPAEGFQWHLAAKGEWIKIRASTAPAAEGESGIVTLRSAAAGTDSHDSMQAMLSQFFRERESERERERETYDERERETHADWQDREQALLKLSPLGQVLVSANTSKEPEDGDEVFKVKATNKCAHIMPRREQSKCRSYLRRPARR